MRHAARYGWAFAAGFLMALGRIGELRPFGPALFYSSLPLSLPARATVALGVVAGSVAAGPGQAALAALACVAAGWALASADARLLAARRPELLAALACALVRVAGWAPARAGVPMWWVETAAEAALAGGLVRLWAPVLEAVAEGRPPEAEGVAGRAAAGLTLAAALCLGLQAVGWGPLQPAAVAVPFVTMAAASVTGAAGAASVAVVTGGALAIGDARWVTYALAVAMGGVAASGAAGSPRAYTAAASLAGVLAVALSAPSASWVGWALAHAAVAALAFCLLPGRVLARIEERLWRLVAWGGPSDWGAGGGPGWPGGVPAAQAAARWLAGRLGAGLDGVAAVVDSLRAAYEAATSMPGPANPAARWAERVQARCCSGCPSFRHCWETHGHETFWDLVQFIEQAREAGEALPQAMPAGLAARCVQPLRLSAAVVDAACLAGIEATARAAVHREGQRLAAELEAVAEVLREARRALLRRPEPGDWEAAGRVARHLSRAGLPVASVMAFGRGARREVVVQLASPCPAPGRCTARLAGLVSEVERGPYEVRESVCRAADPGLPGEGCWAVLGGKARFALDCAFVGRARSGEECSGDSFVRAELGPALAALVVSDGMGSGAEAARESEAAVRLAEAALVSGLDSASAIRAANAALLARAHDDRFATLDVAVLDLFQGELELAKAGAFPSFLFRAGRAERLEGRALPAGIVPGVEVEPLRMPLMDGDVLVMLTDGATQLGPAAEACLQHAVDLLSTQGEGGVVPSARQVAEAALACLEQLTRGRWPDDVTAAVAIVRQVDASSGLAYTEHGSMRPARVRVASKQRQRRNGSSQGEPEPLRLR